MTDPVPFRLQLAVFALVAAAFTNIYITQPVLPVLQQEFGAGMVAVSLTVSAVILGIALANLPFGYIADRFSIRPIIFSGSLMVAGCGLACALTQDFYILISARFLQGLFIPALTTCIAAYLSKTLPHEKLSIIMGAYVSATVAGGMGGRLLGGFIHPPLHWRYAFISAGVLILLAAAIALLILPRKIARLENSGKKDLIGYLPMIRQWNLLRFFFCAAGSFALFSTIFNYLPFRLSGPPFEFSTRLITLLYLAYVVGIFTGPIAGKISSRYGSSATLLSGSLVISAALAMLLVPDITSVVAGLLCLCAGFFTIHAAAVGALNERLSSGQGRANALYVLFYYVGGWLGITVAGYVYQFRGWTGVIGFCFLLLVIPVMTGIFEARRV